MSLLEVRKPAPQHRIEISDRPFEAHASAATRLGPDTVLELVQALLAHETPAGFKTVTQELKALSRLPTVADTRAAGARGGRAAFGPFGPGVFVGCSVRPFSLTQAATSARAVSASSHDRHRITKLAPAKWLATRAGVISISHHAVSAPGHQHIQGIEIDVGQQRADHRTSCRRRALRRDAESPVSASIAPDPSGYRLSANRESNREPLPGAPMRRAAWGGGHR